MTDQINWQGTNDALCGVYCAARIIACHKVARIASAKRQSEIYETAFKKTFRAMLMIAENSGLLTAKKVSLGSGSGYNQAQLETIVRGLGNKDREFLVPARFSRPQIRRMKNSERRALVLQRGVCAIIQEHGGDHWITVEGKHKEAGYHSFDPDLRDNTSQREKVSWVKGLFLLPPEVAETLDVSID